MNDRELLELAAKAAGVLVHWGDGWQSEMMFRSIPRPNSPLVTNVEWNPLNDDDLALRLAVKCGVDLQLARAIPQEGWPHDLFARACVDRLGRCFPEQVVEDPYAATRRAIVRAAAEIGKAMP